MSRIQQWKSRKGGHTYERFRDIILGVNDTGYRYILVNSLYKSIKFDFGRKPIIIDIYQ